MAAQAVRARQPEMGQESLTVVSPGHDIDVEHETAKPQRHTDKSAPPTIRLDTSHGYPSPPGLQYPSTSTTVSPSTSTTSSTASLSSLSLSDQVLHNYASGGDHDHDMETSPTLAPPVSVPIPHEADEVQEKWRRQLGLDSGHASKRGPTTPDPTVICPPQPKSLRASFDANDAQHSIRPSFGSEQSSPIPSTPAPHTGLQASQMESAGTTGEGTRARRESYSPSNSPASTAREGLTPKAELPPLVWPLSAVNGSMAARHSNMGTALDSVSPTQTGDMAEHGTDRGESKRDGSWRKKHAS